MNRVDNLQHESDAGWFIAGEANAAQSFVAHYNGLSTFRFAVNNPALGGSKRYVAQILNAQKEVLREMQYTQSNFGWGSLVPFDFVPITGSQGKTFYFKLRFNDVSSAEEGFTLNQLAHKISPTDPETLANLEKNHSKIIFVSTDRYPEGELWLNDQKVAGDLLFETYYRPGSLVQFARDSLNDVTRKLAGDPQFLIIYTSVLVAIFFAIVRLRQKVLR